jgi:hypothetical protein
VTTQLRLVEPPEPSSRPASGTKRASKGPAKGTEQSRARRGRATVARTGSRTGRRDGRRSAAWGDWRLDAGTRRVGREGVAQARRALEQAALEQEHDHHLSQAS